MTTADHRPIRTPTARTPGAEASGRRRRARAAALGLAALALAGCKEELHTSLTEGEANEVVAALMEVGIPASKEAGAEGYAVLVDESRFAEAFRHIDGQGLPRQDFDDFLEVFPDAGLVPSPAEERARMIYLAGQDLGRTIAEIDGVLTAHVRVVLPQADLLGENLQPSSASVFIRHLPDAPIAELTANIKNLVETSIEGLEYDNVTVVAVPAPEAAAREGVPEYRAVLGIWAHPGSVARLWTVLGSLAGVAALAIGLAGAMLIGRRRAARTGDGFDEA